MDAPVVSLRRFWYVCVRHVSEETCACRGVARCVMPRSANCLWIEKRLDIHGVPTKKTCVLLPFSNVVDVVFPWVFDSGLVSIHGASRTPIHVK